ncbi:MAG: DUF3794 domain-containing protein [Candidatus Coproplasma sp.]
MLKPVLNSEGVKRLIKQTESRSVVESRFPQSSEICEIIAVEPQLSTLSCEVADGRVNYGGKIVLTIVYSDEKGKLCRMQKGVEFSHYCEGDEFAPAQTGVCSLQCDKISFRRDGSSFVISAIVVASISVYEQGERAYVTTCEGAFVKNEELNFCSQITFSGESEAEDDFEADSLIDVLIPSAKAVVLSAECGTGDVDISGEIYLSLFAMRRQSPVCIERIIPFKMTVPCDDASAGLNASARAEISDLNLTANVNEDKGRCNLNFTCTISVNGWFTAMHTESVATDAFASDNKLNLTFNSERGRLCREIKVYSENVKGIAVTRSKLSYDCQFLAAVLPAAECEYNAVEGSAEGAVTCQLIYMQGGEVKSAEITLPVCVPLKGVAQSGQEVSLDIAVGGMSVKLKAEGEAEAAATLKICATVCDNREITYLSAMEEGEAIVPNECAVSVFLPAAGDGLWEVAKKLGKSPSDVVACNSELTFPLSGKERILIYRGRN